MLQTPINSGAVDHGEDDPTIGWQYCDAGNPYKPGYECAICGATGDQPCNGGQYVSPDLRRPLRTKERARQDIDNARAAVNRTPLQQNHKQSARSGYAAARLFERWAADATARGDVPTAEYYHELAEAVAYNAAVTEASR